MSRMIVLLLILLSLVMTLPVVGLAGEGTVVSIHAVEDYARYDQIITGKFLHSETQLVLLERKTTTLISPEQEGPLTSSIEAGERKYFSFLHYQQGRHP